MAPALVTLLESKPLIAALGLATHAALAQGEPDASIWILILLGQSVYAALNFALISAGSVNTVFDAFVVTTTAFTVYFATIFTSIVIYRFFFHRLRHYPGPLLAKVTKFYSFYLTWGKVRYFAEVEKLHKQYGDYIRLGPRELSIADVDAVPVVHGALSKCTKGPWYQGGHHIEGSSLHTCRDKKEHRDRRRIWDRGFNAKALRDYEPRVMRHTTLLMDQLKERAGKTLRFSDWVNFYSFDVMGDIGFSRSFGMLEKGKEDQVIKDLHGSMEPLGIFRDIAWFTNLLLRLPVIQKTLKDFMKWTSHVLKDRKKVTPDKPDIFSWLLDPTEEEIPLHLNADTRLVIVAGSDTTASTLTWLMYELCKHPDQLHKLQAEIDRVAGEKTFLTCEDVENSPLLDGYISEALRLHPAVPSGVQRETPPEGIHIKDKFIPGNTIIWMPVHTIQRDARYFPKPLEFMPERWTTKPEYVVDKRAFLTFSTGPYKCIGEKLAMMEMRAVMANIMRNFDVKFAPSEDCDAIENQTKDTFTLTMGKLDVVMTLRGK
ncbi:putative cytochrome P450 [Eremomyces bilateralis CBS 781.70]|uniref:Cytochrome P450 n=1 Tax=Eremomyces bilateralis CBS 781.70 TaxID=1392243 RepID=A0A6G1FRR1_9PEZI|nr:putative cytochrome P450 [Eremomyces bilateralis CBS 781.70]KAF1808400.1 putative cytochrome P450 [Eremomyces bilateralis CBS 781.70]